MIKNFVERFDKNRDVLLKKFKENHPEDYTAIVRAVVETLSGDEYSIPDPARIHVIDDGDYQGTLVYVIGAKGYQPNDYWYMRVYYGSCSGCDTLEAIRGYSSESPSDEQAKDYLGLALNIVQGIKEMSDDTN